MRPAKLLKRSAETVPAAWKVPTTGNRVLRRKARTAFAFSGLLASRPSRRTGRAEALMRFAPAASDSELPGPNLEFAGTWRVSHFASPSMMSFGRFTNAAPGRSDSAARNAFAMTSPTDSGEFASAQNFVTGLNTETACRV